MVWQAQISPWGLLKTSTKANPAASSQNPNPNPNPNQATLNLRLPGQYFDAETGLHDNWHRTYDPSTGRYLQPDPLGYPDGPDPYLYVRGDPLNRIDPQGLYDADVHYYMTYFLALTAGLSADDAWIIATAGQTMDNVNPYTDAMPFKGDGFAYDQRKLYHFTQDGFDPTPLPGDVSYTPISHVKVYSNDYQLRRLPASPPAALTRSTA